MLNRVYPDQTTFLEAYDNVTVIHPPLVRKMSANQASIRNRYPPLFGKSFGLFRRSASLWKYHGKGRKIFSIILMRRRTYEKGQVAFRIMADISSECMRGYPKLSQPMTVVLP